MTNIYIVEKSKSLRTYVSDFLNNHNYLTYSFSKFSEASLKMEEDYPDLVIIGSIIDIDKMSATRYLSKNYPKSNLIHILDEIESENIMRSFKLGLDDFIKKPINLEVLLSRIKISLTDKSGYGNQLKIADLVLNVDTHEILRGNRKIDLSPTEFLLLKFLLINKNQVINRDLLLRKIWDYDSIVDTRVIDVNISSLRKKITMDGEDQLIYTVRGFGYKISEN